MGNQVAISRTADSGSLGVDDVLLFDSEVTPDGARQSRQRVCRAVQGATARPHAPSRTMQPAARR